MRKTLGRLTVTIAFVLAFFPCLATGASAADPCPRPMQGSEIAPPPDLYSQNGVLNLTLDYKTTTDQWGRTLFCYVTPDGLEAPTLHVNPGDTLKITLANVEVPTGSVAGAGNACGSPTMTTSTNIHFHGVNVSPLCHADNVIRTFVNPGETFDYRIKIPASEPPGLYWYHQNVAGISSPAVQGGASGAIEVEGIANLQPAVQGLPQRFLLIRDQPLAHPPKHRQLQELIPSLDVSLNYVPVSYPRFAPGVIKMQAGAQEFWRLANASSDTVTDIQLLYDDKAQPLQIVALDGVPTGSGYGTHQGTITTRKDILIPPGGRAEFIVTGPSTSVQKALLITRRIDTGPAGGIDVERPLARIRPTNDIGKIPKALLPVAGTLRGDRFAGVDDSMVTARRKLYFSEMTGAKQRPEGISYFITLKGDAEQVYNPNGPPQITTHKGAIEDWTIQNRTQEVHEFHIHQIHFQVIAIDGKPVPPKKRQWYDTYQVGYWDGVSKRYPSVTLRMDFRGNIDGESVYQCEILGHEDGGMAAKILVLPMTPPKGGNSSHQAGSEGGAAKKASAARAASRA